MSLAVWSQRRRLATAATIDEASVVRPPEIRYARSADVAIAYQVVGQGPTDVVFVPFFGNIRWAWEQPLFVGFFERVSSWARLILFDKRGTGLSDRPRTLTLESQMDDIRAVLDAVGSERAALLGAVQGSQLCALFAATYPERTSALILYHPHAGPSDLSPAAMLTPEEARNRWGTNELADAITKAIVPSLYDVDGLREWFVDNQRFSASPGAAAEFFRMLGDTDISDVLPAIRVRTVVMHRRRWRESAQRVASQIPGATIVQLPGDGSPVWSDDEVALELERVLGGGEPAPVPASVLATVLFTDIMGSTERAAELGDVAWRDLLTQHHAAVRRELARFRGRELDTAGDGFLATFDGPARAIRCAEAIIAGVGELGLDLRAGLHTGECELHDGKLAGIALSIGARVASLAASGEVLVSSTVKDLVAGSGLRFDDRGEHHLKGVTEPWRLFAVTR
jgi:class 3 adenylate cyclase